MESHDDFANQSLLLIRQVRILKKELIAIASFLGEMKYNHSRVMRHATPEEVTIMEKKQNDLQHTLVEVSDQIVKNYRLLAQLEIRYNIPFFP